MQVLQARCLYGFVIFLQINCFFLICTFWIVADIVFLAQSGLAFFWCNVLSVLPLPNSPFFVLGSALGKTEASSETRQSRFWINRVSLVLRCCAWIADTVNTASTAIWCLLAEMVINSEYTFAQFLILSIILGEQSLIQNGRYSFHRAYSRPCFLLVTAIFGVSSESGVISHTPPHVLTPVLCGVQEVSIIPCLKITLLSFGNTHADNQTCLHTN